MGTGCHVGVCMLVEPNRVAASVRHDRHPSSDSQRLGRAPGPLDLFYPRISKWCVDATRYLGSQHHARESTRWLRANGPVQRRKPVAECNYVHPERPSAVGVATSL